MLSLIPAFLCSSILALFLFIFWRAFLRPLPKTSGSCRLPGLAAPVEVCRDRWGIPHLRAETERDLFMAQGYVQAQDRLWQMEFFRRIGSGSMAEVFGSRTLEWDKFYRRLGFRRAAETELQSISSDALRAMEAYAEGINHFISTHSRRLPAEFQILRVTPRPWTPLDTLTWSKTLDWFMSANAENELIRGKLAELLGASLAEELEPGYREDHPIHTEPLMRSIGGSNAWAVAGWRSTTGKPLLAHDPHVPLTTPGLWHQMHLRCDTLDVIGATIPGIPGVILGHNRHIAWGVTVSFVDAQDVFIEKPHPEDSRQFEFRGSWEPAHFVTEVIPLRGRKPVRMEVAITRHGPIVTESFPGTREPIAIQWTGHEPGDQMLAILRLNRAQNWGDFNEALRTWTGASFNFVYADTEGNIGYRLSGRVPVRKPCSSRFPKEGWTGEGEWNGLIPFEAMPHFLDPPEGHTFSANNRIVHEQYPYDLGGDYANGYRAQRLKDLLNGKSKLSIPDFRRMQLDLYSVPGKELADYFRTLTSTDPQVAACLDALRKWDGELTAESVGGTIYEVVQLHLLNELIGKHLRHLSAVYQGQGISAFGGLNQYGGRNILALRRALKNPQAVWWEDPETGERRNREAVLATCLKKTAEELTKRLGPQVESWQWGRLHQATFPHAFHPIKFLRWIFCPKPVPLGGDKDTLAQAGFSPINPYDVRGSGVSYRQIIDLSDWDNSIAVCAPGQSGHPLSRHYKDLLRLWRQGEYHPMVYEWSRVEEMTQSRLLLEP
ncbi:MAG: penicillin acylase family protein [Armatimonadetes bacterium]|nr:penicillin acylase family protein [Armatimonadota bacterium]